MTLTSEPNIPSDKVLLAAVQYNIDAYGEQYNLESVKVTDSSIHEATNNSFVVDFVVEYNAVLKYTSAAQLPHVQALSERFGIISTELTTQELVASLDSVAEHNNTLAKESISIDSMSGKATADTLSLRKTALINELAAVETARFVADLEKEYIGKVSTFSNTFRATFDASGTLIDIAGVDYTGNSFDAKRIRPSSHEEMRANGAQQFTEIVDVATKKADAQLSDKLMATAALPLYHRVSASNYAKQYSSNTTQTYTCPTPKTTGHDHSGTVNRDTNKHNKAKYATFCIVDCANYVSQAMFEGGGIPKVGSGDYGNTSYWYYSNTSWENCTRMYNYFYGNGYWSTSSFANCNAGGVIFLKDSFGARYHVVMCVHNDTATRAYAAHTSDKSYETYLSDADFGAASVEYYVFAYSAQD